MGKRQPCRYQEQLRGEKLGAVAGSRDYGCQLGIPQLAPLLEPRADVTTEKSESPVYPAFRFAILGSPPKGPLSTQPRALVS